ncbi:hypothetical protein Hanom_Chr14g01333321 [Helianthus anomalus]
MRDADGIWSSSPTTGVSDGAFLVASDGGGSKVIVVVIGGQQRVRSVFQRLGFHHESLDFFLHISILQRLTIRRTSDPPHRLKLTDNRHVLQFSIIR